MFHFSALRTTVISILVFCFVGCVSQEPLQLPTKTLPHNSPIWQQHQQAVNAINHYSATGQLGYLGDNKRFSSAFDWQYLGQAQYRLHFSSLLSSSTLTIEKNPMNTVIYDNKGNYYADKDIHQLLQDIIGFDFPVEQFPNWIKGLPGNTANYIVDQQGLLSHFDYHWQGENWQAHYINYNQTVSPKLPENLLISGPNKKLKIQIKQWKF